MFAFMSSLCERYTKNQLETHLFDLKTVSNNNACFDVNSSRISTVYLVSCK